MVLLHFNSILVKLDKQPGDYALRLHSLRSEQIIQGAGILRYPTGNKVRLPKSRHDKELGIPITFVKMSD